MVKRRLAHRVILFVLIAGAIVFVLLLAGVASGVLTNPIPYSPPA